MPEREYFVHDSRVANFLMNREKSRHLDPFLGRDCTLGEAAAQLGLGKSRMSYWITRLLELGLIEVVRIERQERHKVRVYRSVADSFAFPLELLHASDVEILEHFFNHNWRDFLEALAQAGRKNAAGWHIRLLRRDVLPTFQIVPASGELEEAQIFNVWARLKLSPDGATAFREDLQALLEHHIASAPPQGKPYLLHLGLVEKTA